MTEQSVVVDRIQPPARSLVCQTADTYRRHLGQDLVSLVAHGSAVKGGLIPGSSDVDLVAFLRPHGLTPHGELPLDVAIRLHRDLSRIDPAPFRYIQGIVLPAGDRSRIRFIPESYCVVLGDRDVPIATADQLMREARAALDTLEPERLAAPISNALLDQGEGRLFRQVRGLCTVVWPLMYQVACIYHGNAVHVWQRTKFEVAEMLTAEPAIGPPLSRWMDAVTHHYDNGENSSTALEAIRAGVSFLDAADEWYRHL